MPGFLQSTTRKAVFAVATLAVATTGILISTKSKTAPSPARVLGQEVIEQSPSPTLTPKIEPTKAPTTAIDPTSTPTPTAIPISTPVPATKAPVSQETVYEGSVGTEPVGTTQTIRAGSKITYEITKGLGSQDLDGTLNLQINKVGGNTVFSQNISGNGEITVQDEGTYDFKLVASKGSYSFKLTMK